MMIEYKQFVQNHTANSKLPAEQRKQIETVAVSGTFDEFEDLMRELGWPSVPARDINGYYVPSQEISFALETRYPFFVHSIEGRCDSYISTDDLPTSWLATILLPLCEDIREICLHHDKTGQLLCAYVLAQVKEKFGTLRWYDEFPHIENNAMHEITQEILDETHLAIHIAEAITTQVCICCGSAENVRIYRGWIHYECDDCAASQDKVRKDNHKRSTTAQKLVGEIHFMCWTKDTLEPMQIDVCAIAKEKGISHCLALAQELDKRLD
jgi:hypothetical protein